MKYKALFLGSFLSFLTLVGIGNAAGLVNITDIGISNVTQDSATVTWITSSSTDSQILYGTTTDYALASALQTATTTSHSVTLNALSASTTYNFMAQSSDGLGNTGTSSNYTFTTLAPDTTVPVISLIAISGITQNQAMVSWTTNEPANSQVAYGTSTTYTFLTPLQTSATTTHTVLLGSLTPSTVYHFAVTSRDIANNQAISQDQTFTTADTVVIPPVATTTADILAKLKIEPRVLNAKSRGKWVEAELSFPSNGYTALDVNSTSIKLNGVLSPERVKIKNKRNKSVIEVDMKFSRKALIDLFTTNASSTTPVASTTSSTLLSPTYQTINISVTGIVGTKSFSGSSSVKLLTWTPKVIQTPTIKKEKHEQEKKREKENEFKNHSPITNLIPASLTTSPITSSTIKNIVKQGKEKKEAKSKKQENHGKGR